MKTNEAGLELIKRYEGLRLSAYQCSAGVWTIGYGHVRGVKQGQKITQQQAEEFLIRDLVDAENAVIELVHFPISSNQFSALVSFVFNLGRGAFAKSTLLKKINEGKLDEAANEFKKWVNVGGAPSLGLIRRRESERQLFLKV